MNVPFKMYLQNLFLDLKLGASLADSAPPCQPPTSPQSAPPGSSLTPPRCRRTGLRPHQASGVRDREYGMEPPASGSACPKTGAQERTPGSGPVSRREGESRRTGGLQVWLSQRLSPTPLFLCRRKARLSLPSVVEEKPDLRGSSPSPSRVTHMCARSPFPVVSCRRRAGPLPAWHRPTCRQRPLC